ncbi:MAG: hypothetical protein NT142_17885 [Planctomycetota bacterium]|nr:hypothetical protein [Planctomycetota bacterium]
MKKKDASPLIFPQIAALVQHFYLLHAQDDDFVFPGARRRNARRILIAAKTHEPIISTAIIHATKSGTSQPLDRAITHGR